MADLVEELFDWLEVQAAVTAGTDWHCGHLPPEVDRLLANMDDPLAVLIESGGPDEQTAAGGNVGAYRFQVLTLGPSDAGYFGTRNFAMRFHALLRGRAGLSLPTHEIGSIKSLAALQPLPRGQRFRYQFSANYIVRSIERAVWWAT